MCDYSGARKKSREKSSANVSASLCVQGNVVCFVEMGFGLGRKWGERKSRRLSGIEIGADLLTWKLSLFYNSIFEEEYQMEVDPGNFTFEMIEKYAYIFNLIINFFLLREK